VGMVQASDGPRFALETLTPFWFIRDVRRQNFDRDDAVEARVTGAIHLTHASRANCAGDFVWP
jgi:hypothetical protein